MKTQLPRLPLAALPLAVLAAFPHASFAQTSSVGTLPETVVTANRFDQPITDVIADVSLLDRTDFERMGATTLSDVLSRLSGLQVVEHGASSVYVRGAEARMTALYIDGVRVESLDGLKLGGGAPWGVVPISQIDRIEILRGPASAAYGSDAMGGVIHIFTRKGEAGVSPYASLGFSSFNTKELNAGVKGAQGQWDFAAGVAKTRSDGYDSRPDLTHTPQNQPEEQVSGSLRAGLKLNERHRLEASVLASQKDFQEVPWGGGDNYLATSKLQTLSGKWSALWSESQSSELTLGRSSVKFKDDAPNDYETRIETATFQHKLKLEHGIADLVLEHRNDSFDAQPTTYDPALSARRNQDSVGVGYALKQGDHALQLRWRTDHDSTLGSHQSGAIAYGFNFSPSWRGVASWGTAFRAPTLEQLYGPYGSTALQPETNESMEVGFRFQQGGTRFSSTFYENRIKNLISSSQTLSTCAAGFFCYFNVGQARIQGLSLSMGQQLGSFDINASWDLMNPRDTATGRVLSLRARQSANVSVFQKLGSWGWGIEAQAFGRRFDNAANTIILPGYGLVNLVLRKEWSSHFSLVARVANAGDRQYEQVGGVATPGRTFHLTLNWNGGL